MKKKLKENISGTGIPENLTPEEIKKLLAGQKVTASPTTVFTGTQTYDMPKIPGTPTVSTNQPKTSSSETSSPQTQKTPNLGSITDIRRAGERKPGGMRDEFNLDKRFQQMIRKGAYGAASATIHRGIPFLASRIAALIKNPEVASSRLKMLGRGVGTGMSRIGTAFKQGATTPEKVAGTGAEVVAQAKRLIPFLQRALKYVPKSARGKRPVSPTVPSSTFSVSNVTPPTSYTTTISGPGIS